MPFTPQDSERFARLIERRVAATKMPYKDAVVEFCETRNLEPQQVVKLLSPKIRTAIQSEAEALRLIRRESALPL